ncbi:MAG: DUF1643 domain-containing protein [Polyangiaceae bacterium]|nr:DUF1643 domain-containing protein [Polyangiaceae bacterium]
MNTQLVMAVGSEVGSSGARFSADERHRYVLWRDLEQPESASRGTVCFLMLNPSTADHTRNDPTIRRCIGYARRWGFNRLTVVNLHSFRSTDPRALYTTPDTEGDDENKRTIVYQARSAQLLVCAWGQHGALRDRGKMIAQALADHGVSMHVLGLTKAREPAHPLMLKKDLEPTRWML